jgi:hypothetical protein
VVLVTVNALTPVIPVERGAHGGGADAASTGQPLGAGQIADNRLWSLPLIRPDLLVTKRKSNRLVQLQDRCATRGCYGFGLETLDAS